jgi:hypothetical protein
MLSCMVLSNRADALAARQLATHTLAQPSRESRVNDTLLPNDRDRILEAYALAARYGDSTWREWSATSFPILLVTENREFLIRPNTARRAREMRTPSGFTSGGFDERLRATVDTRARTLPTGMLATFPLTDASPVVVIGRAETTGKSTPDWLLTLLHEHFHQLQFAHPTYYDGVKALDLARGDTTGMWALNFDFPYDSTIVQQKFRALTQALVEALDTVNTSVRPDRIADVRAAYDSLSGALSAEDVRYLNFQLWQEGAARYTEYRLASIAAADPGADTFHGRPWPVVRDSIFRAIVRGTAGANLARQRREVVYPVGAAIAIVLDAHDPTWRDRYFSRPFVMSFSGGATREP